MRQLVPYSENLPRSVQRNPAFWSVIIPAAGRGSRLGIEFPKILLEVAPGKTILDALLDIILPRVDQVTLVASPLGEGPIRKHLNKRNDHSIHTVIQECPLGMGDAVWKGVESGLDLKENPLPHVLVLWGDQLSITPETLDRAMGVHEFYSEMGAVATLPTTFVNRPYIHFERDTNGRIMRLLQAREGDALPDRGESDCGFFLFERKILYSALEKMLQEGLGVGSKTGERNFLPLFPELTSSNQWVISLQGAPERESRGVNTWEDVKFFRNQELENQELEMEPFHGAY